ncbi:hypothetical protein C8F04DRAFT_1252790 [Mycena alexandri]|uniref:Uncharacterized protein n=1 Tax=Mycena alexandri TaxID=1745969 RepID=A0AAD6S1F2_9AGAR|nr:hypothetical protein C8F04DRAFT_1280070 [Mycena alexandri]KAJ7041852.1 hypothetical protein C8F04DRAFT_1252790 [Mycena alexandri]
MLQAGLVLFGVGLQHGSGIACSAGIYLCVVFYATSKILIYLYRTEKVHIVWGGGVRRRNSPVFLICMGTVTLYIGVVIAMIIERIAYLGGGDGICVIGLKPAASLSLLSFDLYANTGKYRNRTDSPLLGERKVEAHSYHDPGSIDCCAHYVNIAILTAMYGREFGWICLGSCGSDVLFNAVALFWVTAGRSAPSPPGSVDAQPSPESVLPSTSGPGSTHPHSVFRPFHLRPKATNPAEFQIQVTTTSEVETSPPSRHAELESMHEDGPEPNNDFMTEIDLRDDETQRASGETKRSSELGAQKRMDA